MVMIAMNIFTMQDLRVINLIILTAMFGLTSHKQFMKLGTGQ